MTLAANLVALANRVVGVLANNLVALDGNGKLPVVDGSQLTNIAGLGKGQTLQDVTGSRSLNTVYQNTTEKPIMVSVSIMSASGSTGFYTLVAGPTSSSATNIGQGGSTNGSTQSFSVTGIIPPGYYYKLSGGGPSLAIWSELR